MSPTPLEVLHAGTASLTPGLQPDGTLHDPVFDCPTQYGTAYYAWCCSVLADRLPVADAAEAWRERARRAVAAAVRHTTDPEAEPYASGFDHATLSVTSRLNHRDFTWPPIMKTLLGDSEPDRRLIDAVSRARIGELFRTVPPSNWAAVWMSGEWLRIRADLATTTLEELERWIDVFFDRPDGVGFDLDLGLYVERGLPNAYDLFTRAHLTDLLANGYRGRNLQRLRTFLEAGLRRSLAMQLSDGSLASGYRSAGQTWVLGAQIALFQASAELGLGTAEDQAAARRAAWRAFRSLAQWQRPDREFSPVQNLLDPTLRVGYEAYTADGHYSPLALAFLAGAVAGGFGEQGPPPADAELDGRTAQVCAEAEPTFRGVAHRGRISVAVQARADGVYDATGAVDLTFGAGRLLQLVSSTSPLNRRDWLVPGLAVRTAAGAAPLTPVGSRRHCGPAELQAGPEPSLRFRSVLEPLDDGPDPLAGCSYEYTVMVTDTGVDVVEEIPGCHRFRTLLVPYPRDIGIKEQTTATATGQGIRLALGPEWVEVRLDDPIERIVDVPSGYASRRGLCGLVRIDLRDPGDRLQWSVTSSA